MLHAFLRDECQMAALFCTFFLTFAHIKITIGNKKYKQTIKRTIKTSVFATIHAKKVPLPTGITVSVRKIGIVSPLIS